MIRGRDLLARSSRYRDVALAVALCAAGQYELFGRVTYGGAPVWPGPTLTAALVIPVLTLPLALRRRWPTAVCLFVFVALAVSSAIWGGAEATTGFLIFIATTFTAAAYSRWPVLAATAALAAGTVHELRDPSVRGVGDAVWGLGMLVISWSIGWAVRVRQRRIGTLEGHAVEAEQRHAEQVAAATAAERAAIARELHDIVAHAVSVIVIQAQAGARALPGNAELAGRVLEHIESTGRTALAELRGLLSLLAEQPETAAVHPAASLAQLDDLIERCRASGLRVEVEMNTPLPPLSPLAELAAYRVIQEALTNTLRHAPGAAARVRLQRRGSVLEIHAEDDGTSAEVVRRDAGEGSGRGLIGMRERLALAGGELVHAGPSGAGFRVHAVLPVDELAVARSREVIA